MRTLLTTCIAACLLSLAACDQLWPTQPERLIADAGQDTSAPANTAITLTASATGGVPPYLYRWNVEDQPDDADYSIAADASTNAVLEVEALAVAGDYVFRVHVTDSAGATDRSYVTVTADGETELETVDLEITAEASSPLAKEGETVTLEILFEDIDEEDVPEDREYTWTVDSGSASLDDDSLANPVLTIEGQDTIKVSVDFKATNEEKEYSGAAEVYVVGLPEDEAPEVIIGVQSGNTGPGQIAGEIVMELLVDTAPATCANFLRYVDEAFYDGLLWHRVVTDSLIQTGAYQRTAGELAEKSGAHDPIESEAETSGSNVRGTAAAVLDGIGDDTATSQFFINVTSNGEYDADPAHTVFAKVTSGMDLVDQIAAVEVDTETGFTNVPVEDVLVATLRRPIVAEITAEPEDSLVLVGESTRVSLAYEEDDLPGDPTFEWEVVSGNATLSATDTEWVDVTINGAETVQVQARIIAAGDSWTAKGRADAYIVGIEDASPQVVITNSGGVNGEIVIELLTDAAPNTCANFLRYVDEQFFDGVVWHRVVDGFVIQGGAYEVDDEGALVEKDGARDPVASEANNGYSNTRGYIAMALRGEDADSGSNQFFINLADNSNLDSGSPPFTVWAKVVEGMSVIDEIASVEVGTDSESGMSDVPKVDVVMETIRRQD